MSEQKAPSYDEVAARLDRIFSSTFALPTIRELKAACGGSGSLSTYQGYINRWSAERRSETGVSSIMLAMEAERKAHEQVMSLLAERLKAHMRFSAPFDAKFAVAEISEGKGVRNFEPQRDEPSHLDPYYHAERFHRSAEASITRFADADDRVQGSHGGNGGRNEDRSDRDLEAEAAALAEEFYPFFSREELSRCKEGRQLPPQSAGSNQPDKGESGNTKGSSHEHP